MLYISEYKSLKLKQFFASSGVVSGRDYSVLPVVTLNSEIIGTPNTIENVTTWSLNV